MNKTKDITLLLEDLNNFYATLMHAREYSTVWFPPTCPVCGFQQTFRNGVRRVKPLGLLSDKFGSNRQVCLKCGSEFELQLVSPPKR